MPHKSIKTLYRKTNVFSWRIGAVFFVDIPGKCFYNNCINRRSVLMTEVVAALIWDGDRFLACQRPAHKTRGLLWEFVGGKVEPGEAPKAALIRECQEELDVTVAVGDVYMELIHEYPDLTVRLVLYNARITQGVPRKLEHNDIRWITVAEIDKYSFCPADGDILKKLQEDYL
jgi:8-oxo-dGTP diphosphatase